MIKYIPIKENLYTDEIGAYTSYGIIAKDNDGQTLKHISDVSPDAQLVVSICNDCNAGELALVHLLDVIEDKI